MGLRLRLAVRVDGEADLQQHEAAEEPRPVAPVVLMTLRDIEGWESIEVCNVLEVSETNQRVLLHRARTSVRTALEPLIGTRR